MLAPRAKGLKMSRSAASNTVASKGQSDAAESPTLISANGARIFSEFAN